MSVLKDLSTLRVEKCIFCGVQWSLRPDGGAAEPVVLVLFKVLKSKEVEDVVKWDFRSDGSPVYPLVLYVQL